MTVTLSDNEPSSSNKAVTRRPSLLRKPSWRRGSKKRVMRPQTVGTELDILHQDHVIKTEPADNKRRRTLQLRREPEASWGFTLQSYGIRDRTTHDIEMLSYVDYVEMNGAAYLAGLQRGDVILSIDGVSMERAEHPTLVHYIQAAGNNMRLVVLFEDCCRKVELQVKHIRLQQILAEKELELRSLEVIENRLLSGEQFLGGGHRSLHSSSSTLYSDMLDTASLRPELDRCPTPLSLASPPEYNSLPNRGKSRTRTDLWKAKQDLEMTKENQGSTATLPRKNVKTSVSGDISFAREKASLRPSFGSLSSFKSADKYNVVNRTASKKWSFRRRVTMKEMQRGELNSVGSDPELVSLRRLCNDFRMDYIHNSITAGKLGDSRLPSNDGVSSVAKFYLKDSESVIGSGGSLDGVSVGNHSDLTQDWIEMNMLSSRLSQLSDDLCMSGGSPSVCSMDSDVFSSFNSSPVVSKAMKFTKQTDESQCDGVTSDHINQCDEVTCL